MKKITQQDIEIVKGELAAKRKEFEELGLCGLEKRQLDFVNRFYFSHND